MQRPGVLPIYKVPQQNVHPKVLVRWIQSILSCRIGSLRIWRTTSDANVSKETLMRVFTVQVDGFALVLLLNWAFPEWFL